jgi:hypothetical protein
MALRQHFTFATRHHISIQQHFPELLFLLFSSRPDVCRDALDSFPDFLALAIEVLHSEFFDCLRSKTVKANPAVGVTVTLRIHKPLQYDDDFQFPLSLLQAICVILGIFNEHSPIYNLQQSTGLVADLANALLHDVEADADDRKGLASALVLESGIPAIAVEWVRVDCLLKFQLRVFSHFLFTF